MRQSLDLCCERISVMNPRFERKKPSYTMPSAKILWDTGQRETYYDTPRNAWCRFRRSVILEGAVSEATVQMFADTRYLLYVNGVEVATGPCRSDPRWQYYDTVSISEYLREGKNTIAVLVLYLGYGTGQSISRVPALYADIKVTCGDTVYDLSTDDAWRCSLMTAHDASAPRVNGCKGLVEAFDNRRFEDGWQMPDFDDSGWNRCHLRDPLWSPYWNLLPRPIPMLERRLIAAETMTARGRSVAAQGFDMGHLHHKIMKELTEAELTPCQEIFPVTAEAGDPVLLTVDFGQIYVGTLEIEAEGCDGAVIDAVYSETLVNGKPQFDGISYRPISRFVLREGINHLPVFFGYEAFRYVTLMLRSEQAVTVRRVSVKTREYPFPRRASFVCENADMNRLWEISTHTLEICLQDAFLDSPSREQQQWMGDGRYQALFTAYYAGDTAMARKLLGQIAQSQDREGMTCSRYPDANHNLAPIPTYCLQWLAGFADYDRFTHDTALIEEHYTGIVDGIRWFSAFEGEDGLLSDLPYWNYCDTGTNRYGKTGDFFRGGTCAFHNLFYLEAMDAVIRCADRVGDREAVDFFTVKRKRLAESIRRTFWCEEKGVYLDCVRGGTLSESVSEAVNAMAILHLEEDPARRGSILRHIWAPETKYDDVVEVNVYSMPLVSRALKKLGQEILSVRIFLERYQGMLKAGADTTWEYWWLTKTDPKSGHVEYGSACHAWGAAAILLVAENVLGLSPESDELAIPNGMEDVLGKMKGTMYLPGGRSVTF